MPNKPTDALLTLAEHCEQQAWDNFRHAYQAVTETSIDLAAIDFALSMIERAKALRTLASQGAE